MTRPLCPAVAALLLLAASPARAAPDVTFRVLDQLGDTEVEEATAIYIDQHLVGSFHLDDSHPQQIITVTIPEADTYHYAMCGHVSTRDSDGQITDHSVNTSGTLHDVDGRIFEAVTDSFTRYYMRDRTTNRPPTPLETNTAQACAPAVS